MRRSFLKLTVVMLLVMGLASAPVRSNAQIPVLSTIIADPWQTLGNVGDSLWTAFQKAWEEKKDFAKDTAAVIYRTGVRTLLSQIANDVGTWIGSGGKGQMPLFHEDQFGDYLLKAVDTASGAVLDEILAEGYLGGFNFCEPDFNVALKINLGIAGYSPPDVKCSFSTLKKNWEREIRKENFLPDFQDSFNPTQNDIGIALSLQNNLIDLENQKKEAAFASRIEGQGNRPVTSLISDTIRTPAQKAKAIEESTSDTVNKGELQPTGSILADTVDIFLSAVARGFLTNLIKNGFGGSEGGREGSLARANLFNPGAQGQAEGAIAARARLAQSINPSFNIPGRYNVISQLVECTDPANPGQNKCVIDDNFATAINRRLTVKQAIDEGLIRGDRPFGYTGWDPQLIEPSISEGVPYRSILILRTYRIVPVGWEIAARYIGNFDRKRVTLNQLIDEYDIEGSEYYGLVDPNWVLVPPDAFCKLSGPGAEITYTTTVAGTDANKDGDYDDVGDTKPRFEVQRDANYCADEQTCIKTDDSGACQFYGYCLEERPSLDFQGSSCEARFSTCTTLENIQTGSTHSYLLNTVDFDGCSANTVGCQQYATWQRLDVPTESDIRWDVDRTDAPPVFLNGQTEACDARDDGCHAYIQLTNLSRSNVAANNGAIETLKDTAIATGSLNASNTTLHLKRAPDWLGCRGCQAAGVGVGGDPTVVDIEDVTRVSGWLANGCSSSNAWPCDDGEVTTEELEQVNIAFQQGTCSSECLNYAPFCSRQEVGCTAYIPTNGNPPVTAVSGEQCAAECVGFDVYTKSKSFLDPVVSFASFIPSTARSCSVTEAGCTAFTNLSKEGQGGESREYYKEIRYCELPEQNKIDSDSEIYYSWEGSDETGYQLRTFELKEGLNGAPCTNITYDLNGDGDTNDPGEGGSRSDCDDANSPHLNVCTVNNYQQSTDCRQFYHTNGTVSYRPLSQTIAISEDCTPLRRTGSGTIANDQAACDGSKGYWNTDLNACIYQAIPTASQSCSAVAAGCKLYQGGTSANYQTLLFVDFENGSDNFEGGVLSSVSSSVGGHSYRLEVGDEAETVLGLNPGQSTRQRNNQGGVVINPAFYKLSFYARTATGSANLGLSIDNTSLSTQSFTLDSTWRLIEVDPFSSLVTTGNLLTLSNSNTGTPTIYIDNINLRTSIDTFAVIENSWSTPISCLSGGNIEIDITLAVPKINCQTAWLGADAGVAPTSSTKTAAQNNLGPCTGPGICTGDLDGDGEVTQDEVDRLDYLIFNPWQCVNLGGEPVLGCQSYTLSSGGTQNIWKFGPTCRTEAVSCEALIDTQNYTLGENPYEANTDFDGTEIAEDSVDYLVNRSQYQCNGAVQGCMLLGQSKVNLVTNAVSWSSAQLINNPDRYGSILCDGSDIGCSAYTNGKTTYYFKDPQNKVCEYRTDKPEIGWYKLSSTAVSPDCQAGSFQRNFAPGDSGQGPVQGWVGLCPATVNSCTEYIDPRSDGQVNLLENGRFITKTSTLDNTGQPVPRSWALTAANKQVLTDTDTGKGVRVRSINEGGVTHGLIQSQVKFEAQTLYVLSADVYDGDNSDPSNAFVGVTNCSFENIVTQDVYCPAIGGTETSPPVSVTTTTVDATRTNNQNGCAGNYVNGVCIGDLNNDGVVEVNELISVINMADGVVQAQCGGRQKSFFSSPDNSLFVGSRTVGGDSTLVMGNMAKPVEDSNEPTKLSSRIYFNTNGPVRCDVIIGTEQILSESSASSVSGGGHYFSEVSLRRANTYYQLADKVDKNSCSGNVNNADCVLVNERSVNVANFAQGQTYVEAVRGYAVTNLNADSGKTGIPSSTLDTASYGECVENAGVKRCTSLPGQPSCNTHADCQLHYDSNTIVKVTPTRECSVWLSCRTSRTVVENGVTKQVCLDVESCEQINERGECVRTAPSPLPGNLTFDRSTVSRLKNLSGYTTAGYSWDNGNKIVRGNISPALMTQVGEPGYIINGDFEVSSPAGEPVGWLGWENGVNMRTIADPVVASAIGINYPAQGRAFLEVNANHAVPSDGVTNVSNFISVGASTNYSLSALINTLKFVGTSVQVTVLEYNNTGNLISADFKGLTLEDGFDWTKVSTTFSTEASTTSLRLFLTWSPGVGSEPYGYWFLDDVQLKPSLVVAEDDLNGDGVLDSVIEAQSCRLYPTEDAPACEFINDAGLKNTGRRGYCLVKDPQNSNYCIQWWPVDSITGEDLGEDRVGYDGPIPLYYCASTIDSWVQVSKESPRGLIENSLPTYKYLNGEWSQIVGGQQLAVRNSGGKNDVSKIYIDVSRAADSASGDFAIGGLIDKPGRCVAEASSFDPQNHVGCELRVRVEEGGGDDALSVWVGNDFYNLYKILQFDDSATSSVNNIPESTTSGNYASLWADLAWARDDKSNLVKGPFRYLVLGTDDSGWMEIYGLWLRPAFSCNHVVQAVTSDGKVKGYASRLVKGSEYEFNKAGVGGKSTTIVRDDDAAPFGAASPPEPIDTPTAWDSSDLADGQPLFPYPPQSNQARSGIPLTCTIPANTLFRNATDFDPNQVLLRAIWPDEPGSDAGICAYYGGNIGRGDVVLSLTDGLSKLFVETYGVWEWDLSNQAYERTSAVNELTVPKNRCPVGSRPDSSCGIAPKIPSIKVNGGNPVNIKDIGTVTLSFTTNIDADQLPLVQYRVDWGDGVITTQSGLKLQNRTSEQNAITLTHNYSYDRFIECLNDPECSVNTTSSPPVPDQDDGYSILPRVQIIDNWGWCNGDTNNQGGFHVSGTLNSSGNPVGLPDGCGLDNPSSWRAEQAVRVAP